MSPTPRPSMALLALASLALLLAPGASSQPIGGVNVTYFAADPLRTACGLPYDVLGASVSPALWGDQKACGACYSITCDPRKSPFCLPKAPPVIVTVTNLCARGPGCTGLARSVTVTKDVFTLLARTYKAGVLPVEITPSKCDRVGGVSFTLDPKNNQFYLGVIIGNVGGDGALQAVYARFGTDGVYGDWMPLVRLSGSKWGLTKVDNTNQVVSFKLSTQTDDDIVISEIIPAVRFSGMRYNSAINF